MTTVQHQNVHVSVKQINKLIYYNRLLVQKLALKKMKDPTSVSLFKDKTNIFTANNGHAIHPAFNEGFL